MPTAVIVDSAATLPAELVANHGIHVVPLHLTIGSSSYHDGEVGLDELLARLDEGASTSSPSPGEFAAAIEAALGSAEGAVVLTVSSEMSSSFRSAHVAAEQVAGDVRVIDSGTAAGAEGLVALAAARAAAGSATVDDVERAAKHVAEEVRLVATVDSLDRLVQSGRVRPLAGRAGKALGVNPLFEFRYGQVRALRPAFSRDAALDRAAAACRDSRPNRHARLHAAVMHAQAPEAADRLRSAVAEIDPRARCFVGPFSAAMVIHTGPGLAGLAWWWEA